jgi:biofilm PGA synthesis N-glycosyltransferase PgaC
MMAQKKDRYVIVSPVKDEARFIQKTLDSVVAQTIRPVQWIIVDDGSRDETPAILHRYAEKYDWIRILTVARDAERRLGSAEIRAFQAGYESLREQPFDFVVKLDGDLELPPDYFARLLGEFHQDEKLGIASGIYLEYRNDTWGPIEMPPYHAAGASKMVRRQCFDEIHGFPLDPGWDTIDEIRAQVHGWNTCHYPEIPFRHLRNEGSANGALSTNVLHGKIYYLSGGGGLFFWLKWMHRLFFGRPFALGALAMLWGYLTPLLSGQDRLVTKAEARLYRRVQNRRILQGLSRTLGIARARNTA